jgi:N-acetylglucosamine kinase-like BadF-type ATPase
VARKRKLPAFPTSRPYLCCNFRLASVTSPVAFHATVPFASRVHFLGLDLGGTQGRFAFWPPDELPAGRVATAQPAVQGIEAAVAAVAEALTQAQQVANPTAAVCAMAGIGDQRTSEAVLDGLRARGIRLPLAIIGDVLAAAAAGLREGPGVLLWSGTGSFVLARDQHGELHRIGGRGFLLGDHGSGYDLVRRAAVASMQAVDGLGPATALTEALTAAFFAASPQRLGAAMQVLPTGAVASQLPTVLAIAAAGDAVANAVVADGVQALVQQAEAAVRRAELQWPGLPVVLGGGVLHAPAVHARLEAALRSLGAATPLLLSPFAAAAGAAWLAHGSYHGEEPQTSWVHRVAV